MKRVITFCLLAVSLILSVTLSTMLKSDVTTTINHTKIPNRINTINEQHEYNFDSYIISAQNCTRNGRIRRTNSFQRTPFRSAKSSSEASRIKNSTELEHQKFITEYTRFISNATFSQTYYLYNLRKLLI
jgi:hypothetical protein